MKESFEGIYQNGTVVLTEEPPFSEQQKVIVFFPEMIEQEAAKEKRHTAEEIMQIFSSSFSINTNGWEFNRDEANERR